MPLNLTCSKTIVYLAAISAFITLPLVRNLYSSTGFWLPNESELLLEVVQRVENDCLATLLPVMGS